MDLRERIEKEISSSIGTLMKPRQIGELVDRVIAITTVDAICEIAELVRLQEEVVTIRAKLAELLKAQ